MTMRLAVPSRRGSTLAGAAMVASAGAAPRAAAGALAVMREILSQTEPASALPVAEARTRFRSGVAKNFEAVSAIGRVALAETLSWVAVPPGSLRRDLPQAMS